MQFDNVKTTSKEAREVALPLGKGVAKFMVTFLDIRSVGYQRTRIAVQKPLAKVIAADRLSDEEDREISVRTFVRHALKGWSGITSNGEPVPFTEDNAVSFLVQSPDTFYALIDEAMDKGSYMPSEEDAKNSGTASTLN
jgi:hypothetical protein